MIFLYLYCFWLYYLAAINVYNAYKNKRLSKTAFVLCTPVAVSFYILDILTNLLITPLFLDLPKELTVTERLTRLANTSGWRMQLARWFADHLVNPFDLTALHIQYPGAKQRITNKDNYGY